MSMCKITDTHVNSDCQGNIQVDNSFYYLKDEQCVSSIPDKSKYEINTGRKLKNITFTSLNIKKPNNYKKVNNETTDFHEICRPISPPIVSSTTSCIMAANSHKRRKKCRREHGHYKKYAKASTDSVSSQKTNFPCNNQTRPSADPITPKVTPIFVWANVDDTKIVHVLCEDYDKRNRIRLTRTASGWRSVPLIESLEKCRKTVASQSLLNSVSSKLVSNSPTTSGDCLQTDNLSNLKIHNNIFYKNESIGAAADSTSPDHLSPNSKDNVFSSDEDGMQENLRSIIDKMQNDSLYFDEESETSVSTTQSNSTLFENISYKCPYLPINCTNPNNCITDKKTEEIITSPPYKIAPKNTMKKFSKCFTDNFDILCQSSSSKLLNDNIDETTGLLNCLTSSTNNLHQDSNNNKVTDSKIILKLLKEGDTAKKTDISISCLSAPTDNNFNYCLNNYNQIKSTEQTSDKIKENTALCHITASSESVAHFHNDLVNNYSNTCITSKNDDSFNKYKETVSLSRQSPLPECLENHSPDNRNDCYSKTPDKLLLPVTNSNNTDIEPITSHQTNLSNNFNDNNLNKMTYSSIKNIISTTMEEAVSTNSKSVPNNKINKTVDKRIDDNSNILEFTSANEILDIVDTSTPLHTSTPEHISNTYADNLEPNDKNICQSRIYEDHSTSGGLRSVVSTRDTFSNHEKDINTNLHIQQSKVDEKFITQERISSPSLAYPSSDKNTPEKTYTNLATAKNSILSTLLQTDIADIELSRKSNKKHTKEVNDLKKTIKPEISSPRFESESEYKNSDIENKSHQQEILQEHSGPKEFSYKPSFPSQCIVQDNNTTESLKSFHADNQCVDLSVQQRNIKKQNGDSKSISTDVSVDEECNLSISKMLETSQHAVLVTQDKRRSNNEIQSNCNLLNIKGEDVYKNETSIYKKYRHDATVLKVPLCQSLKASNKCSTRRSLIRKQLKHSGDNILDKSIFKELSSISNEPLSTDTKLNNQNNLHSFKDITSIDKEQVSSTTLPKYQVLELIGRKILQNEKEKLATPTKMKTNPTGILTKEKSTLDPLEQLKDVLSNPMYSVPDPLLVPKARLPALVTCPGREIPRLLARHAQNFSYVSVLSDPDVLVVSLSHLRSLMTKPLNENDIQEYQKNTEEIRSRLRFELLNYKADLENISSYGSSWSDHHNSPLSMTISPSSGVSGSKVNTDEIFQGLGATCNPLNLCNPGDIGCDINSNYGSTYLYEKGPLPLPNEIFSSQKSHPLIYNTYGVSWNDQVCGNLSCFQTTPDTCSLGRNDLIYCPFDSQLQNTFSPYLHPTLSCTNSMPVLRDFDAKNCLPEFCYPWMDFARFIDDKGHHQSLDNSFEHLSYPSKTSQPMPKAGVELKKENTIIREQERMGSKIQPKDDDMPISDEPDKRTQSGQSGEPKIKVRQHLVDPNRRPLLLNPQLRSPYETSGPPFLRPWNSEGFPHPFWYSETDKNNKKFQWTTPPTKETS